MIRRKQCLAGLLALLLPVLAGCGHKQEASGASGPIAPGGQPPAAQQAARDQADQAISAQRAAGQQAAARAQQAAPK